MCKFDAKPDPNANNKGQQRDVYVYESLLLLPFLNTLYVLKFLGPSMMTKLFSSS